MVKGREAEKNHPFRPILSPQTSFILCAIYHLTVLEKDYGEKRASYRWVNTNTALQQ